MEPSVGVPGERSLSSETAFEREAQVASRPDRTERRSTATEFIRILLVTDDQSTLYSFEQAVAESRYMELVSARTLPEARCRVAGEQFDAIFVDVKGHDNAQVNEPEGFLRLESPLPVIALVEAKECEAALSALRQGAHHYLVKGEFSDHFLARSVHYAAERVEAEEQMRELTKAAEQKAEENVGTAHSELRRIFDSLPEAIFSFDLAHDRLLHVSPACQEIFGYSSEELSKEPGLWRNVVSDEDAPILEVCQNCLKTGRPFRYELRIVQRSGRRRWVEIRLQPTLASDETLVQIDGIVIDIEERKRTESAIIEQTRQLRALVTSLDDIVFEIDENGMYLNVWTADESFLARPKGELIGRTIPEIFGDVGHGIVRSIRTVLQTGESATVEYPIEMRGVTRWFSAVVNRVESGSQSRRSVSVLVRDITDRKKGEELIEQAEWRYRSLAESAHDIIFSLSRDGSITSVNPAFRSITQWDENEWLGRRFTDILHPGDRSLSLVALGELILRRRTSSREYRVLAKSGDYLTIEITVTPQIVGGTVSGVLGIGRDLTERKKLQEYLHQSQKLETIGTLAAGIAHDFNNILHVISGHATLLQSHPHEAELVKKRGRALLKAVDQGTNLIRQILTFARKHNIGEELVNVNALLRDLSGLLAETFPRSIEISLELDDSDPIILIDQSQFHQALLNLCINARDAIEDASPDGIARGRIHLQTAIRSREQLGAEVPRGSTSSHFVCIDVSDTGVGMDEATKRRIFEPFFTTKVVGRGTGLGLSVVFGIVTSHHGSIAVESIKNTGTTFKLYFPLDFRSPGLSKACADSFRDGPGGSETILIVESDKSLLEAMRLVLQNKGYTIIAKRDPAEASNSIGRPDGEVSLVLLDFETSGKNTREFVASLLAREKGLKLVVLSGYIEPTMKAQLLADGIKSFAPMPCNPHDLLRIIRDVLDGGKKPA